MAKKRKNRKKSTLPPKVLIFSLMLLSILVTGAIFYLNLDKKEEKASFKVENSSTDEELMNKMKKMLQDERVRLDEKKKEQVAALPPVPVLKKIEEKEASKEEEKPSEVADYEKSLKKEPKVIDFKPQKKEHYEGRPKLAIIIDDVSFPNHVKKIKSIPFPVTPSILPPTKRHPDSHKLAKEFDCYMVHLPLEAQNHNSPEERTLRVGNSFNEIENWIKELKKQFPKALFYNNHTGSKFTENSRAMEYLIKALKESEIEFLDSKTTPRSVASAVGEKYGMNIYSRDVFLDNSFNEEDIKKQLKEAVRIAKLRGKAIAIGHPHISTLSVLKNAKPLLKDVEVVYIKDL
ncbi:MAG: divergent polysaccharide deacetylase family protein [Sulfurospirillaceae bacterium]|jgi:polysaccharide deacetylase 2 family uncharacterized protein YibQ|nr:divergent polysaccharide deacetylase family protein [Sulfurospirillaceae bacterium]MDY0237767.1 divergent polysaccharide deacetylase family protein [Campylobacterales bacterium]